MFRNRVREVVELPAGKENMRKSKGLMVEILTGVEKSASWSSDSTQVEKTLAEEPKSRMSEDTEIDENERYQYGGWWRKLFCCF